MKKPDILVILSNSTDSVLYSKGLGYRKLDVFEWKNLKSRGRYKYHRLYSTTARKLLFNKKDAKQTVNRYAVGKTFCILYLP